MNLMLQLAAALVIDLGLSQMTAARSANKTTERSLATYLEDIPVPKEPTLEESRALLGVNFMRSVYVSNCFEFRT